MTATPFIPGAAVGSASAGRHALRGPASGRPPGAGPDSVGVAERVRRRFAADGVDATPAAVVTAVRGEPGAAVLGDTAVLRLADRVHDQLIGAGPLAPLLKDPAVTDVLVAESQSDPVHPDALLQGLPVAGRRHDRHGPEQPPQQLVPHRTGQLGPFPQLQ